MVMLLLAAFGLIRVFAGRIPVIYTVLKLLSLIYLAFPRLPRSPPLRRYKPPTANAKRSAFYRAAWVPVVQVPKAGLSG